MDYTLQVEIIDKRWVIDFVLPFNLDVYIYIYNV